MKKINYFKLILIIIIPLTSSLVGCNSTKDKEVVLSSDVLANLNNDELDVMDLIQKGDDLVVSEDSVNLAMDNNIDTKNITQDQSLEKIKTNLGDVTEGNLLNFDHEQLIDCQNYYVFQYYNASINMSNTIAWFYVDKTNGKLFVLDVNSGALNEYIKGKTTITGQE